MATRIIYKNDKGGLAVITPAPKVLALRGALAIAIKDVPEGKPFKIIDTDDEPLLADRTLRDAWDIDEAELTDGVGGPLSTFE